MLTAYAKPVGNHKWLIVLMASWSVKMKEVERARWRELMGQYEVDGARWSKLSGQDEVDWVIQKKLTEHDDGSRLSKMKEVDWKKVNWTRWKKLAEQVKGGWQCKLKAPGWARLMKLIEQVERNGLSKYGSWLSKRKVQDEGNWRKLREQLEWNKVDEMNWR